MNKFFHNLSLRGKLTFIITLTSCLVLFLTFIAIIALQRIALRNDLLLEVQFLSRGLSENCSAAMIFNDQQAGTQALETLSLKPHVRGARLYDKQQAIFAKYDQNEKSKDFISADNPSTRLEPGHNFSENHLDVYEPVIYQGETLGHLVIRADLAKVNDVLARYGWIGLGGFMLYSLLALLLASSLQKLISEPVNSLVQSMKSVSQDKNYSFRVKKPSDDELGSLFDGFNQMLSEVEKRDAELHKNQEHLDFLAYHDSLTGLANRLLFHDRLGHSMARGKRNKTRVAILFIDLDRFKNINDSLGHDVGDQVLCVVAERLKAHIRETDTLARMGGDEFVIVLEQLRRIDELGRYAQKLLKDLVKTIEISEQKLHLTASIGISIYPDNGEDIESLMKAADIAMYQAKGKGRNTYQYFSEEMNVNAREVLLLEHQLRDALKKNQLSLHYQPQFELRTGRLVGFEALIRWDHPELGVVSPAEFIPLAEQSDLIVAIGEWVLYTACYKVKQWQQQWQLPLRMAVNISPRQFLYSSLVQTVVELLYKTDLHPSALELEITESMVMENVTQAIKKMDEFNRMGVQLAIDDFGTGYSSLGYLKEFPISKLKIDQSFVRDLEKTQNSTAIVNSIIALGKSMNLEIIAEGVEQVEQFVFLREQGCEQGQGYLFSKPLPGEELTTLLESASRNAGIPDDFQQLLLKKN